MLTWTECARHDPALRVPGKRAAAEHVAVVRQQLVCECVALSLVAAGASACASLLYDGALRLCPSFRDLEAPPHHPVHGDGEPDDPPREH